MKLSQLMSSINTIATEKGISRPWICGGIPRDKVLGRTKNITDIDITTGDDTIHQLAKEIAIKFKSDNTKYIELPDNHARIFLGTLKLDFSSNFNIPNIEAILYKKGIKNPTDMQKELYSRDFTCNALLLSTDLKEVLDLTGHGIDDINKKIIKTCLDPEITLGFDNKRIIRVIYLAAKLGFDIDVGIINWIKNNPAAIANVRPQYLSKKLTKALQHDVDRTVQLITDLGLWPHIPMTEAIRPYANRQFKGRK